MKAFFGGACVGIRQPAESAQEHGGGRVTFDSLQQRTSRRKSPKLTAQSQQVMPVSVTDGPSVSRSRLRGGRSRPLLYAPALASLPASQVRCSEIDWTSVPTDLNVNSSPDLNVNSLLVLKWIAFRGFCTQRVCTFFSDYQCLAQIDFGAGTVASSCPQ